MIRPPILHPDRLPFKLPKPYIPLKQGRAKAMTQILGIQCADGVVIASDNEITAGLTKTQEPKIRYKFKGTNIPFLFAFASNYVNYAKRTIALLSRSIVNHKGTGIELFEAISDECWEFHKRYTTEADETSLLFALKTNNHWGLFSIAGRVVSPEDQWEAKGTGEAVARPLLEQFYHSDWKVQDAALIAAYILIRAGQYATYVGNRKFDIAVLQDNYQSVFLEDWKIRRLQRAFERFHEYLIPLIAAYSDFDRQEPFDKAPAEFSTKLKAYREYETKQMEAELEAHKWEIEESNEEES